MSKKIEQQQNHAQPSKSEGRRRIRIAFDLDGVIIDKPPFIPKKLLEWLFRGPRKDGLHYRFPTTKFEQWIRKLSHFWLFRPPIKKNIEFIKNLAKDPKYELYIVSGRYSFLEKETKKWLEKWKLTGIFKEIFINLKNEQPHLFKERILKKNGIQIFVDDDELISLYLSKKNIGKIFCYSKNQRYSFFSPKIKIIRDLQK